MNDVLRPELLWIEGRCYRVNDGGTSEVSGLQEHDLYDNDSNFNEFEEDDDIDDVDCEIVQIDGGQFDTSIHVSKHYMGFVIGKKGATITRIRRDTGTDIKIPRHGQNITIIGSSVSKVKAAVRRINLVVMASRQKQAYTHFISIPMNSPDIVKNFESFKEEVLRKCSDIEDSLFIRPSKLHITIGIMCLMDNEERLLASKLLTEAKDTCIMPMLRDYLPFKIRLKGLSYMNDDPKAINVLYGCVEEDDAPPGLLQKVVDAVHAHFHKAGFMNKDFNRDNVKLHVTLLNSRYRSQHKQRNDDNVNSANSISRIAFDGSGVLTAFADHDFGVIEFDSVHLSQRSTVGPDGYYQPTCLVSCMSTNE